MKLDCIWDIIELWSPVTWLSVSQSIAEADVFCSMPCCLNYELSNYKLYIFNYWNLAVNYLYYKMS